MYKLFSDLQRKLCEKLPGTYNFVLFLRISRLIFF